MKKLLTFFLFVVLGVSFLSKKTDIPFISLQTRSYENWNIGVYIFSIQRNANEIFLLPKGKFSILNGKDITDRRAKYVADPFIVYKDGTYYIFFEVLSLKEKGDIGVAISKDGVNWRYKKIVLDEPFYLSYPYVFKWDGKYYMFPESREVESVRLYEAVKFPFEWKLKKILLEDIELVDPIILNYKKKWWLFATSSDNANLYLYYSDKLDGIYIKHPQSPIVKDNPNIARLGGGIIFLEDKLIRVAQDDFPSYGNSIHIFEITELTPKDYKEKELKNIFVSKILREEWNKDGIHHLSLCCIKNNKYIAVIDGKEIKKTYGLYINLPYIVGKFLEDIVKDG